MSKNRWSDFLDKLKGIFSRKKKELPDASDDIRLQSDGPSSLDEESLLESPQTSGSEQQEEYEEEEKEFTIRELKISDLQKGAPPPELPPDVLPFPKKVSDADKTAPIDESSLLDVPPVPPTPPELTSSDTPPVPTEDQSSLTPSTPPMSSEDKTNKNIDLSKLQFVSDTNETDIVDPTSPDALKTLRVELPQFEGNQTIPRWRRYRDNAQKYLLNFLNKTRQFIVETVQKNGSALNIQAKDLSWDQVVTALFSPQSRRPIHQVFVASSLLAGTYGLGKISAYLIKGPEKKIKTHSARSIVQAPQKPFDLMAIKDANIFNVKRTPTDNINVAGKKSDVDINRPCVNANHPTSLPLKLVNTVVLQDSVKSMAAVAIRGSALLSEVREGDKLETMAQVDKIERLRVVIKNIKSGECEYIDNNDERIKNANPITYVDEQTGKKILDATRPKEIRNEGNKFTIKKTYRDQILQDVGNILSQARAVQLKNPDGSLSFKMTEIVPGSIYSHLNILDGDIIHHINGREITNLNDVMNMFGRIKDLDHLSISVNRGGSDMELEYDFD